MGKKRAVWEQHHPTFLWKIQSGHRHKHGTRNTQSQPPSNERTLIALKGLDPLNRGVHLFRKITSLTSTLKIIGILGTGVLCACQPLQYSEPLRLSKKASVVKEATLPAAKENSSPEITPRVENITLSGIRFEGVTFDTRTHQLRIIDQAGGPNSEYPNARSVASQTGAIVATNGGFFTPEGAPLGSVIAAGKRSGNWNSKSSLGSGIYRINAQGRASISRRSSFSNIASSIELLQAGPLLIENYGPIGGLSPDRSAARTILLNDGKDYWWIGITSPCSLASLGNTLSQASPTEWRIANALNLDGGRSTELYISPELRGGPIERRGFFNRPVRNFLILKTKSSP